MMGSTTAAARGPDNKPRRKIRNYLLDVRLQLRFGFYLVATAAVLSGFLGWMLWRSYREASRLVALGDPAADEALAALLEGQMVREDRQRILLLGVALLVVVVCLLGFAVVVTHKIAGPALVIGRSCRFVGQGKLEPPRKLRPGDLLTSLADEVSGMVQQLRAREQAEREVLLEASRAIGEGTDGAARARASLERLAAEKAARLQV